MQDFIHFDLWRLISNVGILCEYTYIGYLVGVPRTFIFIYIYIYKYFKDNG